MLPFLFGCGGEPPANLGLSDDRLAPCPESPNCVASDAADDAHRIEAFQIAGDPATAWTALREAVAALPRTSIVTSEETYLHAEARSRIFRFVDDLEFQHCPENGLIALRSAARTGYSDFGVNRERLENLRETLRAAGVLR